MRKIQRNNFYILFVIFIFYSNHVFADSSPNWLIYKTKINGKNVQLALDTGASPPVVLWESTAKKLSLELKNKEQKKLTQFRMKFGNEKFDVTALVAPSMPLFSVDGLIGLPFLQNKIWKINWDKMSLHEIKSVPDNILKWKNFKLSTDNGVLALVLAKSKSRKNLIYLDTGKPGGIGLSEEEWDKWISKNPHLPISIESGFSPETKWFYESKLSWADSFTIGPLKVTRVMLDQNIFNWKNLNAIFGLEALKHFEIVLDLKKNKIFLHQRSEYEPNFVYNRLGATCFPNSGNKKQLVCHVLKNSPAYKAGLRTDDILLKIDDFDMTEWQTNSSIAKKRFWTAKPGTKYNLLVKRKNKNFKIEVILEEIFQITSQNL